MNQDLITIGYHKHEMDFGVSGLVSKLTLEELQKMRQVIIVAIWAAEDMWRRNQNTGESQETKND